MAMTWRTIRNIETVTGTSTTASLNPGRLPAALLTPVAKVLSWTSTFTYAPS